MACNFFHGGIKLHNTFHPNEAFTQKVIGMVFARLKERMYFFFLKI